MDGINRYDALKRQLNITALNESVVGTLLKKNATALTPSKPCIFLSHKSEDKECAKKIGEYIMSKGIDIYLDVDDSNLQAAIKNNDHRAITKFIEFGILSCTHLMAIVSEGTRLSWWVPYEVGFGKSEKKAISTLKLRGVKLPSFLKITKRLKDIISLEKYLMRIKKTKPPSDPHETRVIADSLAEKCLIAMLNTKEHPLSAYLDS